MDYKKTPNKEDVERIQKGLKISFQEAYEIALMDLQIDQGADPFPQTDEQKKASDTARRADRKVSEGVPIERKRKENLTKGAIIQEIATFLRENRSFSCENVEITNKERMIAFSIGSDSFEVTLTQKRKKKGGD